MPAELSDQGIEAGRRWIPVRLTWRDGVATLLIGAIVAAYLGHVMSASIPLVTDPGDIAAAGLLLGFLACVIDEWTVTNKAVVRTLSGLSICAVGIGIAVMATGSESLLAAFMGTLVALWVVTTVAHAGAIALRSHAVRPRRRHQRHPLHP